MWFVTGISILLMGIVISVLEHQFDELFRWSSPNQIKSVLWFSCHILNVKSSYTASLSSIQIVQQLYLPIKGIESLMGAKIHIEFQNSSFLENYLNQKLHFPKSRVVPLENECDLQKLSERALRMVGLLP
ncbi:Glutamate receptor 3.3 [Bienertia sinuspersici]